MIVDLFKVNGKLVACLGARVGGDGMMVGCS